MFLRRAVTASIASVLVLIVAACGKQGGRGPVAGTYHLAGAEEPTSLELRADGTFTLRRDACASIGALECGAWTERPRSASGAIATRDGLYWPTPNAFPSARVERLDVQARDGELLVVGANEWAGTFRQEWLPGRTCAVCDGARSHERPCNEPLPSCVGANL